MNVIDQPGPGSLASNPPPGEGGKGGRDDRGGERGGRGGIKKDRKRYLRCSECGKRGHEKHDCWVVWYQKKVGKDFKEQQEAESRGGHGHASYPSQQGHTHHAGPGQNFQKNPPQHNQALEAQFVAGLQALVDQYGEEVAARVFDSLGWARRDYKKTGGDDCTHKG